MDGVEAIGGDRREKVVVTIVARGDPFLSPRGAVVVAVGYINLLTNKPRWDFAVDRPQPAAAVQADVPAAALGGEGRSARYTGNDVAMLAPLDLQANGDSLDGTYAVHVEGEDVALIHGPVPATQDSIF